MSIKLTDPKYYFNRELSWVEFNYRVLEEALDAHKPLLERVKFLSIFSSNLDEFFMIRVAGLRQQVAVGVQDRPPDGLDPQGQLRELSARMHELVYMQSDCWDDDVRPKLRDANVYLHSYGELPKQAKKDLSEYFLTQVFPVLTPLAIDPGHPFPLLQNLRLYLAVQVEDGEVDPPIQRRALVEIPAGVLPRVVLINSLEHGCHAILLEDLVTAHVNRLFPGLRVKECVPFRVTRNADLEIAEAEASDLLTMIEKELRKRRWGEAVRLEIAKSVSAATRAYLINKLRLDEDDVYEIRAPLDLADFMELYRVHRPELKDPVFTPKTSPTLRSRNILDVMQNQDVLLHHPYESFECMVDLIQDAAQDPKVLAIKQTLYRAGSNSPIIDALMQAAEAGKQVTALVELKARFDEENNIVWARQLEQAGVHVVYGLIGLKTHCKVMMIVRREGDHLCRYIHLGTGNYNPTTAKLYTDLGLLTCNPDFAADVSELFNLLTGFSRQEKWNKLLVAPINLRERLIQLIEEETEIQKRGGEGHIIAKMNSLVDAQIIRALYRASQAGVKVMLIVRGVCCLRPGLPGVSENIQVVSIVGRFLEHSRIYYFRHAGEELIYIGSADWMPRNLNRRVESLFPIESPDLKKRVVNEILEASLQDNVKARLLQPDGTYVRRSMEGEAFESQLHLIACADAAAAVGDVRDEVERSLLRPLGNIGEVMVSDEKLKRADRQNRPPH